MKCISVSGVLVVNVTWRGKTYVGTLLDCTKHDWAPPRFCDSPTSDLDARMPKGRGKRGRGASNGNSSDMSNFTETRASVHSKLRSNSKGRRGNTCNSSSVPVGSPIKGDNNNSNGGLKRKGRPTDLEIPKESEAKVKRNRSASRSTPTSGTAGSSVSSNGELTQQPPSSPVLIECPEPNCNKKYKHINGLKYHQSHAHQSGGGLLLDGDKMQTDDSKDACSDSEEVNELDSVKCNDSETAEKMDVSTASKSTAASTEVECVVSVLPAEAKTEDSSNEVKLNVAVDSDEPEGATAPNIPSSVSADVDIVSETVVNSSCVATIASGTTVVLSPMLTSTATRVPPYLTSSPDPSATSNLVVTPPDKLKTKIDKLDNKVKLKSAASARPIIPVPVAQVITLSANINNSHHVSAASGITSNLKPIQPKPTILGEPTTINPALESLKKDKVKHKKRSRDKDRRTVVTQQPTVCSRTNAKLAVPLISEAVVTTVVDAKAKSVDNVKEANVCTSQTGPAMAAAFNPPVSSAVPLNCLDSSSSLDIGTLPVDSTANDNVQSPAYSDISDANDAPPAPPVLESEVNVKDKPDDKAGKSVVEQPSNLQPGYGIYPYYGQPPYLIPSVPPPQTNSTTSASSECSDQKGAAINSKDVGMSEKKTLPASITSNVSSNMPEYQQKFQQQFYPYSYPGYSFGVDPYRRMQMMSAESNFKQRYDEHEQIYRQPHQQHDGRHSPMNRLPTSSPKTVIASKDAADIKIKNDRECADKSSPLVMSGSETVVKSIVKPYLLGKNEPSNLKEKQMENHQILKENIELKSRMEPAKPYESKAPYLMDRQRPDVRHYSYYQDKIMEEKKGAETHRKKEEFLPASDASKILKPLELSTSRRQSPMSRLPTSSPKTATAAAMSNSKDSVSQLQSFVKDLSKKDKSPSSLSDGRKPELKCQQEGQKPTMETTGPPLPSSYTYMHHPGSYLHPSPHYLSFDPTHPMYRGMNPMLMPPTAAAAAYPGGPPTPGHYLPHQLRYDVPPSASPHPQAPPQMSPKRPHSIEHRQPTKALDLLQQHASQYYSSHKIQELQDRPNKSPSARAASPAGTSTVSSTSRDKLSPPDSTSGKRDGSPTSERQRSPPTQRHLHTHHHTHVGVGYPLYDPYGGKLIAKHQTEIG